MQQSPRTTKLINVFDYFQDLRRRLTIFLHLRDRAKELYGKPLAPIQLP
jgi:hypothetical protein